MKIRNLLAALAVLVACAFGIQAAEIYVAAAAAPGGNGTKDKPYTLQEVFADANNSLVKPGDTVILRGGQYDGAIKRGKNKAGEEVTTRVPFRPLLKGTEAQPIVVTSAPGEWAHLNGTMHIQGCDFTHFMRLEIGDLDWDLYREKHLNETAFNAVQGNGIKLINCNVFGGGGSLGKGQLAERLRSSSCWS